MLKSKKKKLMLLGISLLVFTLFFIACSEKSGNRIPAIKDLDRTTSGLKVTVIGSVSDSAGNISEVKIAWGDGSSDTVSSGFDSIDESHIYNSEGTYEVTVTAEDDAGATTSQTISVEVEVSNQAPVIEELNGDSSGLEATITGKISDSDDNLSCLITL